MKYYVLAEAEVEWEADSFSMEEIVFGPIDGTQFELSTASVYMPGAISAHPTGLVTIAAYDTFTGTFGRLYGNDLFEPMNTPVPAEEDIRLQTDVSIEIYDNGTWQQVPGLRAESHYFNLYPTGHVSPETSVLTNVITEQGSADLQAYQDKTFRLTYTFNDPVFLPGFVSTLDFDTRFAPSGWKYDPVSRTLELYIKPIFYPELDNRYWNVFAHIFQTDESLSVAGGTIASFEAKSTAPVFVTDSKHQAGIMTWFTSDAIRTEGKMKGYLPIRALHDLHVFRASDLALYRFDPVTSTETAVSFTSSDHIVDGVLEGIVFESEPFRLPGIIVATKNLEPYRNDNFEMIKAILKDEMFFADSSVGPADIDAAKNIPDLISRLKDPYTFYMSKEEYESYSSRYTGELVGIGITGTNAENGVAVEYLNPGTPASEAGLSIADVITHVDGRSLAGMTFDEKLAQIRGSENTAVRLTVMRPGVQQPIVFNLIRKRIVLPSASAETINDHTLLLTIRSFTDNLPEVIRGAVAPLYKPNMDLIVDLRDNGGGNVYSAFRFLQSVLADETIVIRQHSRSRANDPLIYGEAGQTDAFNRMIVLANERTASAAEITAVALKDNGAAFLGTKTFGKGISQYFYILPDGSAMRFTDAKFTGPRHTEYNKIGIMPAIDLRHIPNDTWLKLAGMLLSNRADAAPGTGDLRITVNGRSYSIQSAWFGNEEHKQTAKQLLPLVEAPDSFAIYESGSYRVKGLAEVLAAYGLSGGSTPLPLPPAAPAAPAEQEPKPHIPPAGLSGAAVLVPVREALQKQPDGTEVNVAVLSKSDLQAPLSDNRDAKSFIVPVSLASGAARINVPADLVASIYDNNSDSSIVLQTEGASYHFPAALLRSSEVRAKLAGMDLSKAGTVVEVQAAVNKQAAIPFGKLASKAIDFSITVTDGVSAIRIDSFGSQFVSRTLDIHEQTDLSKAIGVALNSDGSVSPVPTQFVEIGGKKAAVLKRNRNSTYAVIELDKPVTFTDIRGSWAEREIGKLAGKLIVAGYPDGTYKPDQKLTRAEYMVLLSRALGFEAGVTNKSPFSDVRPDDWFAGFLPAVTEAGLMQGYEDGTFRGQMTVSREEAAVMTVRALELLKASVGTSSRAPFTDAGDISSFAKHAVDKAHAQGLINGKENGRFDPQGQLTRAEAAAMLSRLVAAFEADAK